MRLHALAHTGHGGDADGWTAALPVAVALAVVYVIGAARAGRWSPWRTASWLSGCGLTAVAGSPLIGAHIDPRVHMLSHLFLGMFAPLGLVLAAPVTLLLRVSSARVRRRIVRRLRTWPVRILAHPVSGLILSVGGLYAVMLSPRYAMSSVLQQGLQLHYLAAGWLLTWSIAGLDPALHRARMSTRVAALLVAAAGHAILAKFLYADAERMATPFMTDARTLQSAAVLMYYGADLAELLLAAILFGTWYSRRGRRVTVTRTDERSLAGAGLGPA